METNEKKYVKCHRLYVNISHFSDVYTSGEIKEYYYIKYEPGSKDFYMDDSVHQGGFIYKHCFKETRRKTLDEVKELMLDLFNEARKEDIDIGITRDGFNVQNMLVNSSVQYSGMIFIRSQGYISRNRRINDNEMDEIFHFLLNTIEPTKEEKIKPVEVFKDFFELDNGLEQSYSVLKEGKYTPVCSIEKAKEFAKLKVEEVLNLVKTGSTLLLDGVDMGSEVILSAYDTSPDDRYISINPESIEKIKNFIKY